MTPLGLYVLNRQISLATCNNDGNQSLSGGFLKDIIIYHIYKIFLYIKNIFNISNNIKFYIKNPTYTDWHLAYTDSDFTGNTYDLDLGVQDPADYGVWQIAVVFIYTSKISNLVLIEKR